MIVLRTVRDGQVTIYGRRYAPEQRYLAYDGRLDGLRFAFALLYPPDVHGVALWGSQDAYLATRRGASEADQARYERGECERPQLIDGGFPWDWWPEVVRWPSARARRDGR